MQFVASLSLCGHVSVLFSVLVSRQVKGTKDC